jgi:hypothetical protein
MSVWIVRLLGKPVIVHHLAADKGFEWKGGEHIETKAESGNLHYDVTLRREIVENVALSEGSESKEAG